MGYPISSYMQLMGYPMRSVQWDDGASHELIHQLMGWMMHAPGEHMHQPMQHPNRVLHQLVHRMGDA